jgi:hypothetical protein
MMSTGRARSAASWIKATVKPLTVHHVIAVATLVWAFGTVWLAYNAYIQIEVMENDQRPWIKVDVKPINSFRFRPDGSGFLPLEITLSNVGRSPAFNIQPGAWGFLFTDKHRDIAQEQQERCSTCLSNSVITAPACQCYFQERQLRGRSMEELLQRALQKTSLRTITRLLTAEEL